MIWDKIARKRTPDYVTVYPYLADLYEQAGQFGQALITAQEGLAVDEFNEALYLPIPEKRNPQASH